MAGLKSMSKINPFLKFQKNQKTGVYQVQKWEMHEEAKICINAEIIKLVH